MDDMILPVMGWRWTVKWWLHTRPYRVQSWLRRTYWRIFALAQRLGYRRGYGNMALDSMKPREQRVKKIFVDGMEVSHPFGYDAAQGWVRHYTVNAGGHLYRDGDEVANEIVHGKVTVE